MLWLAVVARRVVVSLGAGGGASAEGRYTCTLYKFTEFKILSPAVARR